MRSIDGNGKPSCAADQRSLTNLVAIAMRSELSSANEQSSSSSSIRQTFTVFIIFRPLPEPRHLPDLWHDQTLSCWLSNSKQRSARVGYAAEHPIVKFSWVFSPIKRRILYHFTPISTTLSETFPYQINWAKSNKIGHFWTSFEDTSPRGDA